MSDVARRVAADIACRVVWVVMDDRQRAVGEFGIRFLNVVRLGCEVSGIWYRVVRHGSTGAKRSAVDQRIDRRDSVV